MRNSLNAGIGTLGVDLATTKHS